MTAFYLELLTENTLEPFLVNAFKQYFKFKLCTMMKRIKPLYMRVQLAFLASIMALTSFAQEKGLDVDINVKKESEWYQQPWVWIIGAAVFVLLLVALLRGRRSKSE